ncbi:MAG TPA: glycosyltransferase family 1 protein [Candidatus Fimivivens sp.]|nr:glycosyltransferase family 1 protein [Candidatus Fimivivens sp.]
MKTIAIDIRLIGRDRTGDEAVFRNLVRSVLELDRTDRYLLLTDRSDRETIERIHTDLGKSGRLRENAEVVYLHSSNRFSWNLFAVPSFLRHRRIDIFHTQYILPAFVPRRTRIVTHIHDVSFRAFPNLIGAIDRLFLSVFIPRTMRRSDVIVTPSHFTKDEIVKLYEVSPERIVVVPNAVDPSFLVEPSSHELERARSANGLPDAFFLSVGTMQPRKNIPLLIRAFADVHTRFPEMKLVLVGGRGGKRYDHDIDIALCEMNLGNAVIFPGYVAQEDMPSVFRLARGFVFPSRYEGFGIPILEAFAAGIPVAASDIPPFREVGGEAIAYFGPTDVAACAETLYTLLDDNEVEKGRGRAANERLAQYSWEKSAQAMVSCYQSFSDEA